MTLRDALGRGDTPDATDPSRRLRARWLETPEPDVTPEGLVERPVRCDCGRSRPASMLLDVRALPLGLRRLGTDGEPQDFACDVCRSLLRRMGLVTRAELAALLGAPPARVAAIVARRALPAPRPVARIAADLRALGLDRARRDLYGAVSAARTALQTSASAPPTTRADVGAGDTSTSPAPTP